MPNFHGHSFIRLWYLKVSSEYIATTQYCAVDPNCIITDAEKIFYFAQKHLSLGIVVKTIQVAGINIERRHFCAVQRLADQRLF